MKKIENSPTSSPDIFPSKNENQKNKKTCFNTKILIFILISIIICLLATTITILMIHLKSSKNHKNEISNVETEKRVLENQNKRLNEQILNLTETNNNLNETNIELNNKLFEVANDEIKRNNSYKILDDISKEGLSLKKTFSDISENIDKITKMNVSINKKENKMKVNYFQY